MKYKNKRQLYDIYYDILNFCHNEQKTKTEIVCRTNLNFKNLGKYLITLEKFGFIIKIDKSYYSSSEKGFNYINTFEKFKDIFK